MRLPRNDVVICPECVHEFYAICVDDQKVRSAAEARIRELEAALCEIHLYMGRPSDTLRATVRSIVERVLTVPETPAEPNYKYQEPSNLPAQSTTTKPPEYGRCINPSCVLPYGHIGPCLT